MSTADLMVPRRRCVREGGRATCSAAASAARSTGDGGLGDSAVAVDGGREVVPVPMRQLWALLLRVVMPLGLVVDIVEDMRESESAEWSRLSEGRWIDDEAAE